MVGRVSHRSGRTTARSAGLAHAASARRKNRGRGAAGSPKIRRMTQWKHAGGLIAVAALVACGPMYGGKPEKLAKPKVPVDKTLKPDPGPTAPVEPGYVDLCPVDISRNPKGVVRKRDVAQRRVQEGDAELARAQKESDEQAKAVIVKRSLQSYSDALVADPYQAEATLMLAVTYDSFHRKGCALRMLERIGIMRGNPDLEQAAIAAADRVRTNPQWFAKYRDEALKAVVP